GADAGGPSNRFGLGVDEHADTDAGGLELADRALEGRDRRIGGPSRLAGDLTVTHRDERTLVRPYLVHERKEVGTRVAFDVEFHTALVRREHGRNLVDVGRRDLPRVSARMHSDSRR